MTKTKLPHALADQPPPQEAPHLGFIGIGFLTLFGAAYFDNIRGPLLPILSRDLGLPYGKVSWFLTVGNLASLAFILGLMPLLNRFSEKAVTLAICGMAFTGGVMAFWVEGLPSLIILGVLMGGAVAVLGTICNVLMIRGTPSSQRSRILSGGHVMYGLGSLTAPFMVTLATGRDLAWSWLVMAGSVFVAIVGGLSVRLLPRQAIEAGTTRQEVRLNQLQWLIVALFGVYVSGEVMASMWLVTYLTEAAHMPVESGSEVLFIFFFMMALTRLGCFLLLKPHHERQVIWACLALPCLAFAVGYSGQPWAFGFMGVIGPFFPIFLGRVSRRFPEQWRSVTVWVTFAIQMALGIFHLMVGSLTDVLGIRTAYLLSPIMLVITMILLGVYFRKESRL